MTTTTIEETIRTELTSRGYSSYMAAAGPVITKLTEREQEISTQLLDYATDLGADTDEVRGKLTELGLAVPAEPEPEIEDDEEIDEDDLDDPMADIRSSLATIARQIESLTSFARRNGYSG